MSYEIVLNADIYDTLEFVAQVYGGIGRELYSNDKNEPVCIYGCAHFVDNSLFGPMRNELALVGVRTSDNDDAVLSINRSRRRRKDKRVPFADLCDALHIVRGDS